MVVRTVPNNGAHLSLPYRTLAGTRAQHARIGAAFFGQASTGSSDILSVDVPEGWEQSFFGEWTVLIPPVAEPMPDQGWKIHVSARPSDLLHALKIAAAFCVENALPFKHLSTTGGYRRSMLKYADRGSAGKLVTIYPPSSDAFESILPELDRALSEVKGPYILSDTRFGDSPVFFRYGGFKAIPLAGQNQGWAIRDAKGMLVPDERGAVFTLPTFADVPVSISHLVEARVNAGVDDAAEALYPYAVAESLHFSNAGGVYLASNVSNGEKVILKEARKWAGYSAEEVDAVCRLRKEHQALLALGSIEALPDVLDYRVMGDHEFLCEEFRRGETLQDWVAANFPFDFRSEGIQLYEEKALKIVRQIVEAVAGIHALGWTLRDLQPTNVLVDERLEVSIIDLETAEEVGASSSYGVATPGFVPHVSCANEERDAYGLAALSCWLFWPSYNTSFSPAMLRVNRKFAAEWFSKRVTKLLEELVLKVPERLLRPLSGFSLIDAESLDDETLIERLVLGIKHSRFEHITDEACYPGDVTQLTMSPGSLLDIETGAAGVLVMLERAGYNDEPGVEWLLEGLTDSPELNDHGLLRGRAGIASALTELGYPEEAEAVVAQIHDPFPEQDLSLRSGMSGTVLALAHIERQNPSAQGATRLRAASQFLLRRIENDPRLTSPFSETGNAVGLYDGWAGVAIACHQLAEQFDSPKWRDLTQVCLLREVEPLRQADGRLGVNYSGVNFGYLSEGSAGVLFALHLCGGGMYSEEIAMLRQEIPSVFTTNAGLFRGAAGLAVVHSLLGQPSDQQIVRKLARLLRKGHLFGPDGSGRGLLALGDNTLHLSADYSTGAAGILGALVSFSGANPFAWFPVPLLGQPAKRGRGEAILTQIRD